MLKSRRRLATKKAVSRLLVKYSCPIAYHQVRMRVLGGLVCRYPNVNLIDVISGLWGGQFPDFACRAELDELLETLVGALWNDLAVYQDADAPFKVDRTPTKPTIANLSELALVRVQEIERFIEGLLSGCDKVRIPERTQEAVIRLNDIKLITFASVGIFEKQKFDPEYRSGIKFLRHILRATADIMEVEIQAAVLSFVHDRAQSVYTSELYLSALLH